MLALYVTTTGSRPFDTLFFRMRPRPCYTDIHAVRFSRRRSREAAHTIISAAGGGPGKASEADRPIWDVEYWHAAAVGLRRNGWGVGDFQRDHARHPNRQARAWKVDPGRDNRQTACGVRLASDCRRLVAMIDSTRHEILTR